MCASAFVFADLCAFLVVIATTALLIRHSSAWTVSSTDLMADISRHTAFFTDSALLAGTMLFCARQGHYWQRVPFWSELRSVLTACILALLCGGFFAYSTQHDDSRLFLSLTWLLFPVTMMLARTLTRHALIRAGMWQLPVVLVGCGDIARQAERALLSEPRLGYHIVSVIPPTDIGRWQEAARWKLVLQQHEAQLLVLALDTTEFDARALTESLVRARVPFAAMPRLEGLPVLGFEQTSFFSHDTVMFSYRNNLAQPLSRFTKIVFDLCVAAVLLILAAPLLLLIAFFVKLDGGPVLFSHRRVGANGREFPCFKFRSMVVNSDDVLRSALDGDPAAAAEWSRTRKLRNDPRVTWIGRVLRMTSLDELPQLLNVLRLEMSLVGPRPIVRSEVSFYAENIAYYYETRPGLTGLWQVSGRSDTSYAQRVQLDTWYVKNWTMWHDLAILSKTVPAVLKRQGAV